MASLDQRPDRKGLYRIRFRLRIGGRIVPRTTYVKGRDGARLKLAEVTQLEVATKSGYADTSSIQAWVREGHLSAREAALVWPTAIDMLKDLGAAERTNWDLLIDRYEDHTLRNSKAHDDTRMTHNNQISRAERVRDWWSSECPDLSEADVGAVEAYRSFLRSQGKKAWTVFHHITTLRILFDLAMEMEMMSSNPARKIKLGQPKTANPRRVCSPDEAKHLLAVSLQEKYRERINGCLPTLVRLGFYAGLRPEEMCWVEWTWLDTRRRILSVQETVCQATGATWVPKDEELRDLDLKPAFVDYLREEKKRLKRGQFVIRGANTEHPMSPSTPQKIFRDLVVAEGMDPKITLYSGRHTYATELLRSGVDLKTVQARMGHADIRTTEKYLHALTAETHTSAKLPY